VLGQMMSPNPDLASAVTCKAIKEAVTETSHHARPDSEVSPPRSQ
jgi:hypothetical protein